MNFNKVKTLFIYLFAIINIFLIYVLFYINSDSIKVYESEIKTAEEILSQKNITIKDGIIKNSYGNMYYLELKNPMSDKKNFAYNLTGSSVGSNNTYNGKNGKLIINTNSFTFIPKDKGKVLKSPPQSSKTAGRILKNLSEYGFKTEHLKWKGTLEKNDFYEITYCHKYNDYEIFNTELCVLVKNDGIYKIFGKYFEIEGISKADDIKSPIEILINFSENVQNEHINNIETGYYLNSETQSYTNLTGLPVYKITLKNGNVYYYDAIEGNLAEYILYN